MKKFIDHKTATEILLNGRKVDEYYFYNGIWEYNCSYRFNKDLNHIEWTNKDQKDAKNWIFYSGKLISKYKYVVVEE